MKVPVAMKEEVAEDVVSSVEDLFPNRKINFLPVPKKKEKVVEKIGYFKGREWKFENVPAVKELLRNVVHQRMKEKSL